MVGESAVMDTLKSGLKRIAESHGTVLITGESGTGKEVAARYIHASSPRSEQPFLALNCAALSPSLLESELFGHEKGAFTGADKLRKGRFELADGGTLLLDEISEIPPELQAKLLRVLQEQAFERVGSSASQTVDVRVIATTNRNLQAEVDNGRFRGDLYFRLNVLPAMMPSLRERSQDIAALATHFLEQIAEREGGEPRVFSDEALAVLCGYHWPGNVRELQNICERAAVLTPSSTIESSLIASWLSWSSDDAIAMMGNGTAHAESHGGNGSTHEAVGPLGNGFPEWMVCDGQLQLSDIEREAILATLARHDGHRQKSAQALGIGVRTLGLKLKKWKDEHLVEATV